DPLTHASTFNVCPVESRNDENDVSMDNIFCFRNLIDIHEKVQTVGDVHEKVQETLMDNDLFQQDSVVDLQYDAYNFVDEQQEIVEMDIDEEVIEMEENMVEEEECFVGGDESNFQKDENEIPHPEQEMDMQNFHFQVNANIEQSRMELIRYGRNLMLM
nr:hypothetical protein [Tanacetum cinerariifolium]